MILAHVYGTNPVPGTSVITFYIQRPHGAYGTQLIDNLPASLNHYGYVKRISLTLHRTYTYRGRLHSYLSAACTAPAGLSVALFPFAHASMRFEGGVSPRLDPDPQLHGQALSSWEPTDFENEDNHESKEQRMIGKLLDKLTYANVVATIALFGVLGGLGAYAAFRVPPNSVGSRQLKAKAVTGGKIANATISGGKIEEETITGQNIKMSALGTVPQAANATNAANANTVGGHAASCPGRHHPDQGPLL